MFNLNNGDFCLQSGRICKYIANPNSRLHGWCQEDKYAPSYMISGISQKSFGGKIYDTPQFYCKQITKKNFMEILKLENIYNTKNPKFFREFLEWFIARHLT